MLDKLDVRSALFWLTFAHIRLFDWCDDWACNFSLYEIGVPARSLGVRVERELRCLSALGEIEATRLVLGSFSSRLSDDNFFLLSLVER